MSYLVKLHGLVEEIRRRNESPIYRRAAQTHERVLLHFLYRTGQIAQACFLTGSEGLGTPLYVLMRVICEDLFLSLWIANTPGNAEGYKTQALSELTRMVAVNLEKGFAALTQVSTGEDRTAALTPEIRQRFIQPRTKIDQIAKQVGLEKVYDFVYRVASLEVHSKSFTTDRPMIDDEGLRSALPAIISLVQSVILVVDNTIASSVKLTCGRYSRYSKGNNQWKAGSLSSPFSYGIARAMALERLALAKRRKASPQPPPLCSTSVVEPVMTTSTRTKLH